MNSHTKHIIKMMIYHAGKSIFKLQDQWLRAKSIYLNIDTAKHFKTCGANFYIDSPFYLWYEQYMEIGDNFYSSPGLRMECIGEWKGIKYHPQLIIGDNVSFNFYCHIGCLNKIVIGNNVMLGSHVLIEDHSHGTADDIDTPVAKRKLHSKGPIIIEDNVWIGENACILENVRIGKCSIIGANAVVTHDIPPYSVAVGVPAKVIKTIRSGNLVALEK